MIRAVPVEERRARLARRHRLLTEEATDDVGRIADGLVALHSSDPVTVHLSALVRMRTPAISTVETALYVARSVVRHHAMRRTLWVATPEVVRTMHAAATTRIAATEHRRNARLLADNGIADPDAWIAEARHQLLAVLHAHGPATTRTLGERVPALRHPIRLAPGKSYGATVAAHTRILTQLGFEGALVRTHPVGSWVSGQYTWAAMDTWLPGGLGDVPERPAAADLAGRYLRAFGPVTTDDVRWWTGWTVATTRRALGGLCRRAGRGRRRAGLGGPRGRRAGAAGRALGGAAAQPGPDGDGLETAIVVSPGHGGGGVRHQRERRTDRVGGRPGRRCLGADPGR